MQMQSGSEQIKLYIYYADGSNDGFEYKTVDTTQAWHTRTVSAPGGGWTQSEIDGIDIIVTPTSTDEEVLRCYMFKVEITYIVP